MTQRIFDVENEKDMADLWDILPDEVYKIKNRFEDYGEYFFEGFDGEAHIDADLILIDWHGKTEITRPIQEATKRDIGKLCRFWNDSEYSDDLCFGILNDIREDESYGKVYLRNKEMWCGHARRLTKQEIEELC